MAILGSTLTNGVRTAASGTSLATVGNIAPVGPCVLLITVESGVIFGAANTPTLSGGGLTYNQIRSDTANAFFSGFRFTTFWAFVPAGTAAFTLTADFAGQNQNAQIALLVNQVTDVSIGSPIVNTGAFATGTSTTPAVVLSAFASPANGVWVSVVAVHDTISWTAGSGYTSLDYDRTDTGPDAMSEFRATNDPTPNADGTLGASQFWGIVAFELRAALPPGLGPPVGEQISMRQGMDAVMVSY